MANLGQTQVGIPGIPFGSVSMPGAVSELRDRSNPWAPLDVAPKTKTKQKRTQLKTMVDTKTEAVWVDGLKGRKSFHL